MNKPLGYNEKHTIPRDIVAKRVVYDEGDHYTPTVKSNAHCYSTTPLKVRKNETIPSKVKSDPNFKDFTGYKVGNFTVQGLFYYHAYDKWVLRCCCGNYEIRTTKTLKKISDRIDQNRCQSCVDLERIRHRDYFKEHGKYPWDTGTRSCKGN